MKLLRFGEKGSEKPGILHSDGTIRDLSDKIDDLFGINLSKSGIEKILGLDIDILPAVNGTPRIGACLKDTPNFYCIGLNYQKHAMETGMAIPKEPILFSKATSVISGPFEDVIIPKNSKKTDWEVELGVVIGEECSYISERDALSVVSGYFTVNEVSEREFQLERGGNWIKGKSAPTFGPIGPYFVSADEIDDPQNLNLGLSLNGKKMQDSNTSDMIFSVAEIISYMSQFMQLRCGDIISTGTPEGVGMGMKPQVFLKGGDTMEVEVEKCGKQRQRVVDYKA